MDIYFRRSYDWLDRSGKQCLGEVVNEFNVLVFGCFLLESILNIPRYFRI